MKFLELPQNFVDKNIGHTNGENIFNPLITNTGVWVCEQSLDKVFPEIFLGKNFTVLTLNGNDFKEDYSRLSLTYNTKKVYSKVDDYYAKTCTVTFIKAGEKKVKVIDMSGVTPTSSGYPLDLSTTVSGL